MKIVEPGHVYELNTLDGDGTPETIQFVNREPGHEHPGTQTQEVLRALIDRTRHCDNCLRWPGNDLIIHHLRMALTLHEARALERKAEEGKIQPELIVTGEDGHFDIASINNDPNAAPIYDYGDDELRPRLPEPCRREYGLPPAKDDPSLTCRDCGQPFATGEHTHCGTSQA